MSIKTLLLGAAAGLVAVSGASAADLPAKAAPVDYVKVCAQYGAGFFVIPGTDVCLDIGGYVRADYYVQDTVDRDSNRSYTRTRAQLNFDARSQTSHGTLRSFIELRYTVSSGTAAASVALNRAYIQWAGFTFGRAASMFDFYDSANIYGIDPYTQGSGTTTNLLAYTKEFGNGWSATISLEDATFRRSYPGAAGHEMPDVVAAVMVDQSWGSAKLSGAVHQIRQLNGNTDYGFAGQLGVSLKIGEGTLWLQGGYGEGAIAYSGYGVAMSSVASAGNEASAGGALSTSWSVVAAYTRPLTDTLEFNVWASYGDYSLLAFSETTMHVGGSIAWTPVKNLTIANQIEYLIVDGPGASASDWRYMLSVQRSF
jgi:hypothetical protein